MSTAPASGKLQILAILRRRRLPMILTFLAAMIVALVAAFTWPATYVSTGTILIEQQELPSELVPSTITSYADQRIQVISQRVMTTENLLGIIQRYDLYPRIRRREPREVLLERMRELGSRRVRSLLDALDDADLVAFGRILDRFIDRVAAETAVAQPAFSPLTAHALTTLQEGAR